MFSLWDALVLFDHCLTPVIYQTCGVFQTLKHSSSVMVLNRNVSPEFSDSHPFESKVLTFSCHILMCVVFPCSGSGRTPSFEQVDGRCSWHVICGRQTIKIQLTTPNDDAAIGSSRHLISSVVGFVHCRFPFIVCLLGEKHEH